MKKQLLFSSFVCALPLLPQPVLSKEKPNIIFILADDMRASTLELLGKETVLTPNLNKLAQDGLTFTNAHIMGGTSGAVSMPSRAMLMTGRYLHTLEKQGAVIPESDQTIGETLAKGGYETFHIGKWHSDYKSFNRCFQDGKDIFFGGMADHWNVPLYNYNKDAQYGKKRPVVKEPGKNNLVEYLGGEYLYSGKHSVDIFTDAAIHFVEEKKEAANPFFLYLAYMSPHDPRSMPEAYLQQYTADSLLLPANFMPQHPFDNGQLIIRDEQLAATPRIPEEVKEQIKSYYAMISHLDDNIGRLIDKLKKEGQYENTLIIFAADNGLAVGQHGLMGKQNVYEHSVGVPLVIKQAGVKSGKQTDQLCYLIDIFPTLCDITEQPVPQSVHGVSLLPVLNENKPVRNYLYYSYINCQRAISDGTWKLIEYHVKGKRTTQLFNLKKDPMECNNLYADKKQAATVKRLRAQMLKEKEQTEDNSSFWDSFTF